MTGEAGAAWDAAGQSALDPELRLAALSTATLLACGVLAPGIVGGLLRPRIDAAACVVSPVAWLIAAAAALLIAVEVAPALPVVLGDRTRLAEVVQNLLDNAVKCTGDRPQPRIEIGVRPPGADGMPVVFVRDNGVGIDPRYTERVFGLFEKLDPKSEGTGVGLALVRRIVEVHGGRAWAESGGEGRGATFCFAIPTARKGGAA